MSNEIKDWDGTEVEVTLTATFRYKVNAEAYGSVETLEEAIETIDVANIKGDPVGMLMLEEQLGDEGEGNKIEYNVTWRKI